jgi:excisionase family DNA binding protein
MKNLLFEKDPPHVLPAVKPPHSGHDGYISPKELALTTGKHLRTIRRWIKLGHIEYYQPAGPGSTVLIPKSSLGKLPKDMDK